jgi:DNA-binding transcriptional regulator YdaS (Cro superfamily)
MHHRALLKAIKYFGSQQRLAKKIGVNQQCITNWLNRDKSIPIDCAAKIAIASNENIRVCELAPQHDWLARYFRRTAPTLLQIEVKEIKTDHLFTKNLRGLASLIKAISNGERQRPIAISPDYQLLFGQHRLIAYQKLNKPAIEAQVINLPDLLQPTQALMDINTKCTLSERVSLAHQLESYIRTSRKKTKTSRKQEHDTEASDCVHDDFLRIQRTDNTVAQLLQLGGRSTYRTLKQIVQQGSLELITALDSSQISVHQAFQLLSKLHRNSKVAS